MDKRQLTAPCGLDCFNCELYETNITEEMINLVNQKWGVPRDHVSCKGCRQQDGRHFHIPDGCATLDCAKEKSVELCCDCDEFPCSLLAPLADQAERFPHNMKLYNLCRIKKIGLDRWIEEDAGEIRQKYFKSKFVVGKGQK